MNMETTFIVIYAAVWAISSVLIFGIANAYFNREYPGTAEKEDQVVSTILALILGSGGPVGVAMAFFLSGMCKHGFTFKDLSQEDC